MGLWDSIKRAFGGGTGPRDNGLYYFVRCNRCGDRVRVRVSPTSELQQEFDEKGDAVRGYAVRKMVVDQRCFRPIELRLSYDNNRRERSREIEGGTFLTAEEFEAGVGSGESGDGGRSE